MYFFRNITAEELESIKMRLAALGKDQQALALVKRCNISILKVTRVELVEK